MKILGIIPARYGSVRFPGKPLVDMAGKTMIQRVYEQVSKASCFSLIVVATDNQQIFSEVKKFGGEACMTRQDHISGTDRCFEALTQQNQSFDYVINVQGDEPFIQPAQIELLAGLLDGNTEIATLIKKVLDPEMIFNPNVVKAVVAKNKEALYFSRSPIPHVRNTPEKEWIKHATFYKHIGMYAYRTDILANITKLSVGSLETAESLEQLRWLQNGFRIMTEETDTESLGVDTPDDLKKAIALLSEEEPN